MDNPAESKVAPEGPSVCVLRAVHDAQRSVSWSKVAASAEQAARWVNGPHFMQWEELLQYHTVVWWEGLSSEGRPFLVMRLGAAVDRCTSKAAADKMAKIMISQVDYGVHTFKVQGLVVLLDCRMVRTTQVPQLVRLLTTVAKALNSHEASRLHQLLFVGLPVAMRWPLQAARPLVHAHVRSRLCVCRADDASIPVNLTTIPDVW